jgi:transcriptional regulator with XRE-family HTH domain
MTQIELAEAAGVKSYTMISRYERGVRAPNIRTLDALSEALDVTINRLLGAM